MSVLAVANSLELVRRRARCVLLSYSKGELVQLLDEAEKFGEVGIFGGTIRDAALLTPSLFRSDVDVVVATEDVERFDQYFLSIGGALNRFGGYRLRLSRGSVDIWPLKRTWAFARGVRKGSSLHDLIGTTYFSWDSIVYSWGQNRIFCREDYLEQIRERVVELELPTNPNPVGALVRTFRFLATRRAAIGPRLVRNTLRLAAGLSAQDVVRAEVRSHLTPILTKDFVQQSVRMLQEHSKSGRHSATFSLPSAEQLSLSFTGTLSIVGAFTESDP